MSTNFTTWASKLLPPALSLRQTSHFQWATNVKTFVNFTNIKTFVGINSFQKSGKIYDYVAIPTRQETGKDYALTGSGPNKVRSGKPP